MRRWSRAAAARVEARGLEHRADVPGRVVELGVGCGRRSGRCRPSAGPARAACAGSWSCRRRSGPRKPVTAPARALKVRSSTASDVAVALGEVVDLDGGHGQERAAAARRVSSAAASRPRAMAASLSCGRGHDRRRSATFDAMRAQLRQAVAALRRHPVGGGHGARRRARRRGPRLAVRDVRAAAPGPQRSTSRARPGSSWRSWPRRCRWRCAAAFPLTAASAVIAAFIASRLWVVARHPGPAGLGAVHHRLGDLARAVQRGRCTASRAAATALVVAACWRRRCWPRWCARSSSPTGSSADLPLNQAFLLAYNIVFIALPLALGAAVRSLLAPPARAAARARGERAPRGARGARADRARAARRGRPPREPDGDPGRRGAAGDGAPARDRPRRSSARSRRRAARRWTSCTGCSGFLRREGQDDGLAPQPDLAQLPELVEQAGRGPLRVELAVEGEPRPLPPTLEVSAYRVIQEALTNAVKHSGGTTATVRLRYRPAALEVEVLDDGPHAPAVARGGGGLGLVGMRERVALHGGELRAGPAPARRLRGAGDVPAERRRARDRSASCWPTTRRWCAAGFRLILEAEDDLEIVGRGRRRRGGGRGRPAACGPTWC